MSASPTSSSSSSSSENEGSDSEEEEADLSGAAPIPPQKPSSSDSTITSTTTSATSKGAVSTSTASAIAAKKPKRQEKPRQEKLRKRKQQPLDNDFVVRLQDLQGVWRHSAPAIGKFKVEGSHVVFPNGRIWSIQTQPDGSLEMIGWTPSNTASTREEIVWTHKIQGQCTWTLLDDVKDETTGGVPEAVTGKRRRKEVDYDALNKALSREDVRSFERSMTGKGREEDDEEEAGLEAEEAKEVTTPGEWTQLHKQNVAQVMKQFRAWAASTFTLGNEEKLRRDGELKKTFEVLIQGAGRKMLEKELRPYGVKVSYVSHGTLIRMDAANRQRFKEKHPECGPAPQASVTTAAAPSASPSKKGRLKKVQQADEETDRSPTKAPTVQTSTVHSGPPPAESVPSQAAALSPNSSQITIEEAQKCLEAALATKLPLDEVVPEVMKLLKFLDSQEVTLAVMQATKVPKTVTAVRKRFINTRVEKEAQELVDKWRDVFKKALPSQPKSA